MKANLEAVPLMKGIQKLNTPLTRLEHIGPKRASLMAGKGISTVLDLLFLTPNRYEDRTCIYPVDRVPDGGPRLVRGTVVYGKEEIFRSSGKRIFRIVLKGAESTLECIWFNYRKPYLRRFASKGTEVIVFGSINKGPGKGQTYHPEINHYDPEICEANLGFYPVYPTIPGISPTLMRSTVGRALNAYLPELVDPVPEEVRKRLSLPPLAESLRNVHFPSRQCPVDELNIGKTAFHKRLLFDRFFLAMLIIAYRKRSRGGKRGPAFRVPSRWEEDMRGFLGFELTNDQKMAARDIAEDLRRASPMNRLVIGDVGCGKTVLAAVAAYICAKNGGQIALMAPTQVLARQHFDFFSELPEDMGLRPVLVTGKLKEAERKDINEKIRKGCYNLVIGTHILAGQSITYSNLGLVVIDEQQRFGVKQRARMDRKGGSPNQLVMTATPIPRTLALAVYGDMDVSVIREYPAAHRPPLTELVRPEKKRMVFQRLVEALSSGQQAFVICPVIGGSEEQDIKSAREMASRLAEVLSSRFRIGLVHGRMGQEDVDKVMAEFKEGRIDLLVGTSLLEVGVHVPKAQIMIIEHPERFGLAQLHQLRGRVGRGDQRGSCFLMLPEGVPEVSRERLKVLVECSDGFEISEKDLEMRGQGEFFGMRQSGVGELELQELLEESDLLRRARSEAQGLIDSDPELKNPHYEPLKVLLDTVLSKPVDI